MDRRAIFFVSMVLGLSLLLSCRQTEPLAPEEPIVVLLSPADGSTLVSGDVEVRIYLQNFRMVQGAGQPNKSSEGHAIYYLDMNVPLNSGTKATTAPGTFAASAGTSYTWPNVPPGQHMFTVQLVNNDDTPLYAPVTVRANVTLKSR